MFSESLIHFMSNNVLSLAINMLLPLMAVGFVVGNTFRVMSWYTVKRHDWFAREFEKRVSRLLDSEVPGNAANQSFYVITKKMLEKTYYEVFEIRDRMHRRRRDKIMAASDRIFLIRQGTAWVVKDILKQIKFVKYGANAPNLLTLTRSTFQQNPCFNKIFGIIPINGFNEIQSILPGLFVIGGIFGTFLGIVKGLPSLGKMSLTDMDMTKQIMDQFLFEISFAMNSSIIGILFSVLTTIWNTMFSTDKAFTECVDRFETSLEQLWNRSDCNVYPENLPKFDEHRDPSEALAEASILAGLDNRERSRELDDVRVSKKKIS